MTGKYLSIDKASIRTEFGKIKFILLGCLQMLGSSKKISSIKFWIFTVIYIIISFAVIVFTANGWKLINMLLFTGPSYLLFLIYITIICAINRQIHYTPNLIYPILLFQTIITVFNLGDAGYYFKRSSCESKDLIQEFFDFSGCGKVWIGSDVYGWTIFIYTIAVFIFAIDILILRSLPGEDNN